MSERECPDCGSGWAQWLSGAMLPDDSFCQINSGLYACRHCGCRYQHLVKKAVKPTGHDGNHFSPNAKCSKCDQYNTRIVATRAKCRYHVCLNADCKQSFKTIRPLAERSAAASR